MSPFPEKPRISSELKALIRLSAPIIAAQISQCAMGFVDTVMAGRVGSVDLAAVAMGSSIWHPLFLFFLGILMAVTPSVAHLHGAGKKEEIGHHVRQALLLGALLGLAGMVLLRRAGPLLTLLEVDPEAAPLTLGYLEGISWGMPAVCGFFVLRHFSEGLSRVKPSMLVGFFGLAVNIVSNDVLIYGKLGLPALGGVGCGWATALSMWAMFLAMGIVVLRGRFYGRVRLFAAWPRPDGRELYQILRLGLPIGCALFVEASIFAAIALLIGSLGAEVVAAHQICLNFSSLVFMLPLSISSAITVRVGQALGRSEGGEARRCAYVGIGLTAALACLTSALTYLLAAPIAAIYTDTDVVLQAAVGLMALGALFQVSDAIQVSTAGALRGYKDTRVPMILIVCAYWIVGFPVGYSLGLTSLWGAPLGAAGFWIGLIAGLTAAAVLLSLRLWAISRRQDSERLPALERMPAAAPEEGI